MSDLKSKHHPRFKILVDETTIRWQLDAIEPSGPNPDAVECRAPIGEVRKSAVAAFRKPGPARTPVDFADFLSRDLEIIRLKREIERLKADAAAVGVELLKELTGITSELFGGTISLKESFDPEYSSDKYMVVIVDTTLAPKEAFVAEKAWIQQVATITTAWKNLRLSIRFK